ncbi:MAG: GntR family transcriptional regulator [Actinomycetota bacterium]
MVLSVQHTDLATAVTESLRQAIVSGELSPGARLVETDLAAQFGVSRGPIRDALAELQHTGLVELRARKGSFVVALAATDVDEIYRLRAALESLAVHQAVAAGVDEARITGLLADLVQAHAIGDPARLGGADMALHRGIVEAARNRRLLEAWERLADQTLLLLVGLTAIDTDIQDPAGDHRRIVERLVAGDADGAASALAAHLDTARRLVMAAFGDGRAAG